MFTRAGVLERPGVFGARPRPRHMRDHHPIFWAFHPRHRGLQIRLCGPHIQGPPPPDPVPVPAPRVIPRTPLPTPRTTARLRRLGPHRQHQHLGGLRLLLPRGLGLDRHVLDHHVLVTQTGREYPGHAQRRSSFFVLNPESVQNVSRTRRCAQIPRSANPRQRHKSPTEGIEFPTRNGVCAEVRVPH